MLASLTENQQAELADRFAREGIVRIPGVLADDRADRLYGELRERQDWVQVMNSGEGKLFELSRQVREQLPVQKGYRLRAAARPRPGPAQPLTRGSCRGNANLDRVLEATRKGPTAQLPAPD